MRCARSLDSPKSNRWSYRKRNFRCKMRPMRLTTWLLAAVLVIPVLGQNNPDSKEWIQLFNGRNLDGWVPKIAGYPLGENFGDTFRVENGILKVSYDKY